MGEGGQPVKSDVLATTSARRRWGIHVESGFNGLSGTIGFLGAYRCVHKFSLDAALGITPNGVNRHTFRRLELQAGSRARYNFFPNLITPFVAVGVTYAQYLYREEGAHTQTIRVPGIIGVSFASEKGFSGLLSLGVAPIISKSPSPRRAQQTDRIIQSVIDGLESIDRIGPVFSMALGYAF